MLSKRLRIQVPADYPHDDGLGCSSSGSSGGCSGVAALFPSDEEGYNDPLSISLRTKFQVGAVLTKA